MGLTLANAADREPCEELRGACGRLLELLARMANEASGWCWGKRETLAGLARICARTVQRLIARLEALGYLEVVRGTGRGHVNRYRVLLGAFARRRQRETESETAAPVEGAAASEQPSSGVGLENPCAKLTPVAASVERKGDIPSRKGDMGASPIRSGKTDLQKVVTLHPVDKTWRTTLQRPISPGTTDNDGPGEEPGDGRTDEQASADVRIPHRTMLEAEAELLGLDVRALLEELERHEAEFQAAKAARRNPKLK